MAKIIKKKFMANCRSKKIPKLMTIAGAK